MRFLLASLMLAALPALAQVPDSKGLPEKGACKDCGVVQSIRFKQKQIKPAATTEGKPSGLVATVPFGKGADKPTIGSSTRVGKDAVTTSDTWEVSIRLEDGRYRLMVLDEDPGLKDGDKVRIDPNGQIKRRDD